MRVRVRLLGSLRPASTPVEADYELPEGSTVSALVRAILDRHPQLAGALEGVGNLVMLEGVEIGNLSGLDTRLGEGSEVAFVPVTHGGR